jgi:hypothetical protein
VCGRKGKKKLCRSLSAAETDFLSNNESNKSYQIKPLNISINNEISFQF